jgi:hypothetical protein
MRRRERADLFARQDVGLDAVHAHRVRPARHRVEVVAGMREQHETPLAQHDVEVQILGETLVEPQRKIVEARTLGIQVIRTYDRRIAAGVAATDPAALEHGDIRDAMVLGEIIRGRKPVAAAADHDDVVLGFRRGRFPRGRPVAVTRERAAQQGPGRIFHALAGSACMVA